MRLVRTFVPLLAMVAVASCDAPPTAPLERAESSNSLVQAPTRMVDLGLLGGSYSEALDINDNGVVVGWAENAHGYAHAFRWTRSGGMKDLGSLGGPQSFSKAVGINEHGIIAGLSNDAEGRAHLVVWTPSGVIRDLHMFPNAEGFEDAAVVVGISDRNEIAGIYYETELFGWGLTIPFHYTQATGILDYPWGVPADPEGAPETRLEAINDLGDVTGVHSTQLFFSERGIGFVLLDHPWSFARPHAINDKRVIVGMAQVSSPPFGVSFPFRRTRTHGFESLGNLGGNGGSAEDVNERGEIVGWAQLATGESRAFFWAEGRGMVDLGAGFARAINEKSMIVGSINSRAVMWLGTGGVAAMEVEVGRAGSGQ